MVRTLKAANLLSVCVSARTRTAAHPKPRVWRQLCKSFARLPLPMSF